LEPCVIYILFPASGIPTRHLRFGDRLFFYSSQLFKAIEDAAFIYWPMPVLQVLRHSFKLPLTHGSARDITVRHFQILVNFVIE